MNDRTGPPVFHDVGSLFPGEVEVRSVTPATLVTEALQLMNEHRYSQVPVIENGILRGVFSLWSLAQHVAAYPKLPLHSLPVDEVMEDLPRVTVDDNLDHVLEQLKRHEAVLVSSPHGLQAIATAFDVLAYFYRLARPYVLLQEIELALRAVIERRITEPELGDCIGKSLAGKYEAKGQPMPAKLTEMSFDDYRSLVTSKHGWPYFEGFLGKNKDLVAAKLDSVRQTRNKVFHFRGDISVLEHQTLAAVREWLFRASGGKRGAQ